jgi:hypothetical protein
MPETLVDARQTLRWMLKDFSRSTGGIEAFLIAALQDQDWELRASAMLGVGLYAVQEALPLVRRLDWKDRGAYSPTTWDGEILARWQDAILHGAPVHRTDPRDHETMLLYALLNPLSPVDPLQFPHRTGYRYIAAEPHWLGDDRRDMRFPNPIRKVAPARGFWISERRVSEGTSHDALAAGTGQSKRSGLDVRLPTPEQWEMAARSTDARLFPWGNGYQPGIPDLPSPWGLEGLVKGHGEWCLASGSGSLILCGGSRTLGLPGLMLDPPDGLSAGFRFVVDFPE